MYIILILKHGISRLAELHISVAASTPVVYLQLSPIVDIQTYRFGMMLWMIFLK